MQSAHFYILKFIIKKKKKNRNAYHCGIIKEKMQCNRKFSYKYLMQFNRDSLVLFFSSLLQFHSIDFHFGPIIY